MHKTKIHSIEMTGTIFTKTIEPIKEVSHRKEDIVYKSIVKKFNVITKIKEKNDKIIINRTISWYDSKKEIYRRRKECQVYYCEDFIEENNDSSTYDTEFMLLIENNNKNF